MILLKKATVIILLMLAAFSFCMCEYPPEETQSESREDKSDEVQSFVEELPSVEEPSVEEPSLAVSDTESIAASKTHGEEQSSESEECSSEASNERSEAKQPNDDDFVLVKEYIPQITVELKYATEENFTHGVIYDFKEAYLRYGTVKKLIKAEEELEKFGFYLKIWDAFRPVEAQFKLWEICPDKNFVSDPNTGYSSHSKGGTVDITMADRYGNEVKMPTAFDDFSLLADRNYSDCDAEAAKNAELLEKVMVSNGFIPYSKEWWHFRDSTPYEVEKEFHPNG